MGHNVLSYVMGRDPCQPRALSRKRSVALNLKTRKLNEHFLPVHKHEQERQPQESELGRRDLAMRKVMFRSSMSA